MNFPVEIKGPSEEVIEVRPGAIFDISLKVTNKGDSEINLKENIVLPDGWNLVFKPFPFTVKSISSYLRIFSISVPSWADAGVYEIFYEVIDDSGNSKTLSVRVEVSSIISFSLSKINPPEYSIAGEEYSIFFSINNNGNVPIEVEINISDNLSYDIQTKDKTLVIPAKESILSSATITTSESISAQTDHRVLVKVKELSTDIIKEVRYKTTVIPQENALVNRFVLVPSVFTIGTTSKDNDIEFHSKLKLNGFIDSERRLYLNFEIEMLDFKELPDFKLNSLSYNYENFRIRYGKYKPPNYSGFKYDSALESISAELSIENFYLHSFVSTGTEYYGIYADWIKSDEYEYFAALDGKRSEEEKLQVLSLGFMNTFENFYYDGSVRFPFSNNESQGIDFDFDVGYSFNIDQMDIDIDLSYDHGNYVGVKDDSFGMNFDVFLFDELISVSYRFKRYEPFDFSKEGLINYYYLKGNIERFLIPDILFKINLSKNFVGKRQTADIEIDDSFKTNLYFLWDIHSGDKNKATLSLKSYLNIEENNFSATSIANFNLYSEIDDFTDFKINAKINISNKNNSLINPNGNISLAITHNSPYDFEIKSSLNLSMNFETMTKDASANFVLNKYFDENGKLSFSLDLKFEEDLKKIIGDVSFDISKMISDGLELGGTIKYKFNNDEDNFAQASFIVNKYFKERNKLEGKITYDFNKNEDFLSRFSFGIGYTHYFNLPALPRTDLATVEGYIYYNDGEHKRALTGVKVYLNNKIAITSEDGRYYFSGVKEGDYFLKVDNSNIDLKMISLYNLPIKITLEKGEERKIEDIVFIYRSEISIKIIPDKISGKSLDTDDLTKLGRTGINLKGIKIIIRNEESYFVLYTSKDGEAGMERLKPGEWNLKIITSTLPEGYTIDANEYNVTLNPGKKIDVEVQLKEEMMEIIFIDSGDL